MIRAARGSLALSGLTCALLLACASGCAYLRPYHTPDGIEHWQDLSPPKLALREKAEAYQAKLETRHQMPDGLIRYKQVRGVGHGPDRYGNLADGSFSLGIYLASQALRYAATKDPAALEQVKRSLHAMRLYAEVSGKRGLLARYFSPVRPPHDDRWRPSPTHPEYFWRPDVSKDQYAGVVDGLGVTLAVVAESEIRAEVASLASAIADHLIENHLQLIDWDGKRTKHGNLRGRIFGVPIGVNALIALAIAKTAAEATGEPRYRAFFERLVAEGYPRIAYWAHFSLFGIGNPDNDHMAYLALYPLLLLETDSGIAAELRRGGRRTWRFVRDHHNAFFAFIHAAVVENGDEPRDGEASEGGEAAEEGRRALLEFPDAKVAWPVDLTREGPDFPRAFLNTSHGEPRSTETVPLYLRARGSSLWTSDPHRLVGRLRSHGEIEFSGIDYLIAYWMGRYHGFLDAEE